MEHHESTIMRVNDFLTLARIHFFFILKRKTKIVPNVTHVVEYTTIRDQIQCSTELANSQ